MSLTGSHLWHWLNSAWLAALVLMCYYGRNLWFSSPWWEIHLVLFRPLTPLHETPQREGRLLSGTVFVSSGEAHGGPPRGASEAWRWTWSGVSDSGACPQGTREISEISGDTKIVNNLYAFSHEERNASRLRPFNARVSPLIMCFMIRGWGGFLVFPPGW